MNRYLMMHTVYHKINFEATCEEDAYKRAQKHVAIFSSFDDVDAVKLTCVAEVAADGRQRTIWSPEWPDNPFAEE